MAQSRLKNSINNSMAAVGSLLLITILNFINRSVFIRVLGSEYLGINGLFSNILSMLSLSEMGIGTAIVFNMYRAVETKDETLINQLMSFYAKVYTIIGCVIMAFGIICSFFIQYFIKDNPFDLTFLRISFLLLVFNNAVSYFWSYRSCIVFANQKDWVCKLSSMIVMLIGSVLQIAALLLTKNYIVYLVIQVIVTICNNGVQFILSKKMYPSVSVSIHSHLPKDIFKDIVNRVKALIVHSISSALNFGTDNIIISKFVGILETGYYSNYSMIINTLSSLITQLLGGVTASMGNLMISGSKDKIYEIFKKINFLCHWIFGLISVGMLCVINQFINIWTVPGHLLNNITVMILVINFYILGARQAIMVTRNAGGLYTNDRIVAIIKPIINLVFSVVLVQKIGISGVFIGTFISQLVADVILFPLFLFKGLFEKNLMNYYLNYVKNFLLATISGAVSVLIISFAEGFFSGILLFIISGVTAVLVYNILFVMINFKTDEFKYFTNLIKDKLLKIS